MKTATQVGIYHGLSVIQVEENSLHKKIVKKKKENHDLLQWSSPLTFVQKVIEFIM